MSDSPSTNRLLLDAGDLIVNACPLTDFFNGAWPTFHDTEVLSILLDREGVECPSLTSTLLLHIGPFDGRNNSVKATIRFGAVDFEELMDFNHQNALSGIDISVLNENPRRLRVEFVAAHGCSATFTAGRISILDVTNIST
jgi:hypothetical protein